MPEDTEVSVQVSVEQEQVEATEVTLNVQDGAFAAGD